VKSLLLLFVNHDGSELRAAVEAEAAGDAAWLLESGVTVAHAIEFAAKLDAVLGAALDADTAALTPGGVNSDVILFLKFLSKHG
jgi:hypothetical protein